jgi:hypothetical protein
MRIKLDSQKQNHKMKLNLTLRPEYKARLRRLAAIENRSASNLIECLIDDAWARLVA